LLDAVERNLEIEPILNMLSSPQLRPEDRLPLQVVDTPPVDASVLEDLGRLSQDPTFVDRLLRGFRGDTERIVGEIVDAIAHRKYETVKDAAHALKGGAASVGATQLTQMAGRLEKAPHDLLRLKAAQWTEELLRTSARTLDALEAHLEERKNRLKSSN
jgi:HPt (histidine-containing phosphotransfer) domain-containing protein